MDKWELQEALYNSSMKELVTNHQKGNSKYIFGPSCAKTTELMYQYCMPIIALYQTLLSKRT
jgi:hypothetical protein